MVRTLSILILAVLLLFPGRGNAETRYFDIAFDIDNVLLWRDSKPEHVDLLPRQVTWYRSKPSRKGETQEKYWIDQDAGAVLQALLEIPGVRISFISAHWKERADKVFPQLKLPDGRSFQQIAYQFRGYEDISKVRLDPNIDRGEEGPFRIFTSTNGQKKDLRNLIDPLNPGKVPERKIGDTVLVDDNIGNAFWGQEKNMIHLPTEGSPRRPLVSLLGFLKEKIAQARETGEPLSKLTSEALFTQSKHGTWKNTRVLLENKYQAAGEQLVGQTRPPESFVGRVAKGIGTVCTYPFRVIWKNFFLSPQ